MQLERQVGALEEEERQQVEAHVSQANCGQSKQWRPPSRDHGMPDAGVVTLEEQLEEEHAFGPAVALVVEWRGLRNGAEALDGRVDRAGAAVRRWELETASALTKRSPVKDPYEKPAMRDNHRVGSVCIGGMRILNVASPALLSRSSKRNRPSRRVDIQTTCDYYISRVGRDSLWGSHLTLCLLSFPFSHPMKSPSMLTFFAYHVAGRSLDQTVPASNGIEIQVTLRRGSPVKFGLLILTND